MKEEGQTKGRTEDKKYFYKESRFMHIYMKAKGRQFVRKKGPVRRGWRGSGGVNISKVQ